MKKRLFLLVLTVTLSFSFVFTFFTPFSALHTSSSPLPILKYEDSEALQQPFTYLETGGQVFVFASADDKYVLKLFRADRLLPAWWTVYVPNIPPFISWKAHHNLKREAKLQKALWGHYLAYTQLKEESGLIALQLTSVDPSLSPPSRRLQLVTKQGFSHSLELNDTLFILQKKGETLSARITRFLDAKNFIRVQETLYQIASLYRKEHALGILDTDHGVMHNMGFVNDNPIHIDLGCLILDDKVKEPLHASLEREHVSKKIIAWLDQYYPNYAPQIRVWTKEAFQ